MKKLSEEDRNRLFDDMFNEVYPPVKFGCLTYEPAAVLKEIDPTAYRCEVNDYIDRLLSDGVLVEIDGEECTIEEGE
jgi:hypothetical protein